METDEVTGCNQTRFLSGTLFLHSRKFFENGLNTAYGSRRFVPRHRWRNRARMQRALVSQEKTWEKRPTEKQGGKKDFGTGHCFFEKC